MATSNVHTQKVYVESKNVLSIYINNKNFLPVCPLPRVLSRRYGPTYWWLSFIDIFCILNALTLTVVSNHMLIRLPSMRKLVKTVLC